MKTPVSFAIVVAAAVTLSWSSISPVAGQTPTPPTPDTSATAQAPKPSAPQPIQPKRFTSAEKAVDALVVALRAGDTKALTQVLGSDSRRLVSSGDAVSDRRLRERFLAAYDSTNRLVTTGTETVLRVGSDDFPFPIPIVKIGNQWRFDPRRGRDEIIARRIGRNELSTMQVCLAYVDAQREYYGADHDDQGVLEYAQKFASTPGKRDGLYWPTGPGEPQSPLGDFVVRAQAEGYRRAEGGGPTPYYGYLYRILTAQGADASGGAYDYVVSGHMIAGFGLVAFPVEYGVSGVMTFIVSHDGVVYQKDLGPKTRLTATAMRQFNPDKTWTKIEVPATPPGE